MEVDNFLWNAFSQTGSIEAYLLYKTTYEKKDEELREEECHISQSEAL